MPANTSESSMKLAKLIHGIHIAMLTTTDTDGSLRSRPMATQSHEFDGELWFFTSKSSHKVVEIDTDHRVNLAYSDSSGHRYVSISATARLVQDSAKARQLWTPLMKAWFPKGVEDPELRLLKITPDRAEYWESPGAVMQVIEFTKAILKGQRAELGDHGQLNLSQH